MTNEEATKMLRTIKRTVALGNRKFYDALDVAISALETQNKNHCADCQEFDCYGCEYKEHKS